MVKLLKAARFVFLAVLAGAFLAVGSQGILPITDVEAGADAAVIEPTASDDVLARADSTTGSVR